MSEFISPPVEFKTIHGVQHQVAVHSDWGVEIDGSLHRHYQSAAGVVILGLLKSFDRVVKRPEFYTTVLEAYDYHVMAHDAPQVRAISQARNGTNLGGKLNSLMTPVSSPFRTNMLQLSLGFHKRMLFSSNPADEEHVRQTFAQAKLSDDPDVNDKFRATLFEAYLQRRDFLLRKPGGVDEPKRLQRPSDEYVARLNDAVVEVSTRATRLRPPEQYTETIQKPNQIMDAPPKVELVHDEVRVKPDVVSRTAFLPSDDVLRVVGDHIFESPESTVLRTDDLCELFHIHPSDTMKVQNALLAVQRAGYATQKVIDRSVVFVRTKKQKNNK